MATDRSADLRAFHEFVGERLADDGAPLTPGEVLDLWEIQRASDEERAASVDAVRAALDDLRAEDTGVAARAFLAEIRRKYHLPTGS
jgi:hypothetical protein